MKIQIKDELKTWGIYFTIVFLATYVHELGHCVPAWINGFKAIPTPAKEYPIDTIPLNLQQYVSLGGIAGSALVSFLTLFLYITRSFKFNSAILAGAIANPAMYTVMFILKGRGHDDTEFQEAQSALGLNYSGHSIDWFFLATIILGISVWILKSKPSYRSIGRLFIGFILSFIFLVALQDLNNAIFDPLFQHG